MTTAELHDDTRSRILDVALELIAEKGFAATSTREVCERIGFTKAALYYHFKAKDDLLAALVAPVHEALAQLVGGGDVQPGPSARRSVVTAYVDFVASRRDLMRLLYDDPSVRAHPALAAGRAQYDRLLQLLAGTDSPDAAALARARAATGAIHAVLLRGRPDDDEAVLRSVALSTGCAVLGVPAPRS